MRTLTFFDDIYRPQKLRGARPRTVDEYRSVCRNFDAWLKAKQGFADLTQVDVDLYACYLADVLDRSSAATSNKHRLHLNALLRFAVKRKRLTEFPEVEPTRTDKPLPDSWDVEKELSKIIATASKLPGQLKNGVRKRDFWPALLLTLYDTGLRVKAGLALNVEAVDFEAGTVRTAAETQKGRKASDKDLSSQTISYLVPLVGDRTGGRLFPWPYDNGGEPRTLRRHFREILKIAGVSTGSPREMFHKLRRTTATEVWKEQGEAAASEVLDHSAEAITQRYIDRRKGERTNVAANIARPKFTFNVRSSEAG